MKLVLEQEKMFKLTVTQDGQLNVTLANGKQYSGPLTANESEQLLFRVTVISDGAIKFDPMPTDYLGVHETDVATLEAQSLAINELREQLAEREKTIEGYKDVIARLADCETELSKARTELKETLLVVQEQAAKLNIAKPEPEPVKAEPAKPAEEQKTSEETATPPA